MKRIAYRNIFLALISLLIAGCDVSLYAGLAEKEANEMVAILMRSGIPANKEIVGRDGLATIMVDESDFAEAVTVLEQQGYPKQQFAGMGEVFKKDGLISSPTEERARFIFALSQELSNTISQVDGVLSARVHVVVPENDSPLDQLKPSSASVFIKHRPGLQLDALTSQIKMLVTNSIEGLVYDKVTVALFPMTNFGQSASSQGSSTSDLVKVAGIWVHPSSAKGLRVVVYSLLIFSLLAFVVCILLFLSWKRAEGGMRKMRQQMKAPAGAAATRNLRTESVGGVGRNDAKKWH